MRTIFAYLKSLRAESFSILIMSMREDFWAWRRGERRVGARGSRGRVFVKRDGTPHGAPGAKVDIKRVVKITARVTRAAGGPAENYVLTNKGN